MNCGRYFQKDSDVTFQGNDGQRFGFAYLVTFLVWTFTNVVMVGIARTPADGAIV